MQYFEYDSILIRLIQNMDGSESSRKAVIDRISEHPEEVNDWWNHDGWSGTPLTEAMQKKRFRNRKITPVQWSNTISSSWRVILEK